jgi:hypothetical protein
MADEGQLDIRVVTANTIDSIAEITGRDRGDLWDEYCKAVAQGTSLHIFINHRRLPDGRQIADSWRKGECYYLEKGKNFICLIHNQVSRHVVNMGAHLPCVAIDPW